MITQKELQEEAYKELSEKINLVTEGVGDLFPGKIYKDETKIDGGRLKANILSVGRHIARKFDVFTPLFIIGYKINKSNLFFEVWYLPIDGKYIVVDKFGKRTEKNEKFNSMQDALDELVDVVSTKEFDSEEEESRYYQSLDREFARFARKKLKNKYKTSPEKLDRDDLSGLDDFEFEGVDKNQLDITQILEQSVASKQILYDMINDDIKEYNETRMSRSKVSSIWKVVLGRDIKTPTKYIGGIDRVFSITGKNKEATFVVGYSLNNKINIEIWFVKNVVSGKGEFYVFDITAGKILAKGIRTMREAYAHIADKIVIKVD